MQPIPQDILIFASLQMQLHVPVSYTHLDVYKRQDMLMKNRRIRTDMGRHGFRWIRWLHTRKYNCLISE